MLMLLNVNVIECYRMLLSVGTFMKVHEPSKNKVVNDQGSIKKIEISLPKYFLIELNLVVYYDTLIFVFVF